MGFIFRFAGLALVSSMATSVCHSEVLGTFEGRVTGGYERGARAPARMVTGDLVIGCFRYLPEDAEIGYRPDRNGIWQYRFSDVPPRSVFAISIGSLVWRSGEIFTISVANDKKLSGERRPRIGDALIFWYGLHPRYQTMPPLHPGVPPGGLGHAVLIFKAYLPQEIIRAAYERSGGNEIGSGKFDSPESSAALAANAFGFFLEAPDALSPLPGFETFGWPATYVDLEFRAPFPWWPKGRHPWLDAVVLTDTHLIGIESKRYEPFRRKSKAGFSEAYWRDVWGSEMQPFLIMRDSLKTNPCRFERLDAAQLVKHAFGLRTEAVRRGKKTALLYLYAEPSAWPGGRALDQTAVATHRNEIESFTQDVRGAEVTFNHLSYRRFVDALFTASDSRCQTHAEAFSGMFPDI